MGCEVFVVWMLVSGSSSGFGSRIGVFGRHPASPFFGDFVESGVLLFSTQSSPFLLLHSMWFES